MSSTRLQLCDVARTLSKIMHGCHHFLIMNAVLISLTLAYKPLKGPKDDVKVVDLKGRETCSIVKNEGHRSYKQLQPIPLKGQSLGC